MCARCLPQPLAATIGRELDPTVFQDLSIISLVANASVVAQLVMAGFSSQCSSPGISRFRQGLARRSDRQADEFGKSSGAAPSLRALPSRERRAMRARWNVSSGRLRRVREVDQAAGRGRCRGDGRHAAGDDASAREMDRLESPLFFSVFGGLVSPMGLFRHGLGHHECLRGLRPSQATLGHAAPRHRRSADRHHGPFAAIPAVSPTTLAGDVNRPRSARFLHGEFLNISSGRDPLEGHV